MKFFISALLSLAGSLPLWAASGSYYVTSGTTTWTDPVPVMDYVTWWNRGAFSVFSAYTNTPYTPTSLRYFTNSGVMFGDPGYRFLDREVQSTTLTDSAMAAFNNTGTMAVSDRLTVWSSTLVNSGKLICNEQGYVLLNATSRANLQNGGIQAGLAGTYSLTLDPIHTGRNTGGGTNGGAYYNDFLVTDMYWGMGLNNRLGATNSADPISLGSLSMFSQPQTPSHEEQNLSGYTLHNGYAYLPQCAGTNMQFLGFVNTNYVNASNRIVQVVLVASNLNFPNLSVSADFLYPGLRPDSALTFNGHTSIVQFAWVDTNIVDDQLVTSYLTIWDGAPAVGGGGFYVNQSTGTKRPANYEVSKVPWTLFSFFGPQPDTNVFSPTFFAPANSTTNVYNVNYSAYAAWFGVTNFAPRLSSLIIDPTNLHGKAEIFANALNATGARIRAENFTGITTKNLEKNVMPRIDSPIVAMDVTTTNRELVISNTLPKSVVRFYGQVSLYSATWSNTKRIITPSPTNAAVLVTNLDNTFFHVTIVDNCLRPPDVVVHKFVAHAPNLNIQDDLNIYNSTLLDVQCLTVGPNGSLRLPVNSGWGPSNAPTVRCLYNSGTIGIDRDADFRPSSGSYSDFVNHGAIRAGSIGVSTVNFENTGTIPYKDPALLGAGGGYFLVNATKATLQNSILTNSGYIELRAGTIDIVSTRIDAGATNAGLGLPAAGALIVTPSSRLSDGSYGYFDSTAGAYKWSVASNEWTATAGFTFGTRPSAGDLLGTTLRSALVPYAGATHIWPGRDLGPSLLGYTNNLALGRLVLDGAKYNTFSFQGPGGAAAALYVDYLELANDATNLITRPAILDLAGNFRIYFADASIPPKKLDGLLDGRLVWVHEYAGPFSGTNFVYVRTNSYGTVTTNYYFFNAAEVGDADLDSDYDGIPNSLDEDPIFTEADVDLVVSQISAGSPPVVQTVLTWTALAYATNTVEYTTNTAPASQVWNVYRSFVQGPATERVSVTDSAANNALRVYRVREHPRWPPIW